MFKCRFPLCETKDVVLTVWQPGTLVGQQVAVSLPFQKEPPLALIGPFRGLLDQRILRVNGESDWRFSWVAEAKDKRDNGTAASSFMVKVSIGIGMNGLGTSSRLQHSGMPKTIYSFIGIARHHL